LALDGPVNKAGPIVVATTNCFEKLDPALIRPGRFNHHLLLDWSCSDQQEKLFLKYYPNATPEELAIFIKNLSYKQISCAALVGYLRKNLGSAMVSSLEAAKLAQTLKSSEEVAGERINLDSALKNIMNTLNISVYTQSIFSQLGIETIRQFKFLEVREFLSQKLSVIKKYEIPNTDKLALKRLYKECENSKDKILWDFDAPIFPLFDGISKNITESLRMGGVTTLGHAKYLVIEDIQKLVAKYRKSKNSEKTEKAPEGGKIDNSSTISVRKMLKIKAILEKCTKAENKSLFLDLESPVEPHFTHYKISEETQKEILQLDIFTLSQFLVFTVDGIIAEFEKPKYKIPLTDELRLHQLAAIVRDRIEEKEIYE